MSTMLNMLTGQLWVPLDEHAHDSEQEALSAAHEHAHSLAAAYNVRLLIGPPLLVRFHPRASVPVHLVYPITAPGAPREARS